LEKGVYRMNNKHLLKFGLPVLAILSIIIVVAVVLGRDKPSPQVTDSDQLVIDFKGFEMTKGELYNRMKSNYGMNTLLNEVDRLLLKDFEDDVDLKEIKEKYEEELEEYGEEEFAQRLLDMGIYQKTGESDEDYLNRVLDYYKLQFIKEAFAESKTNITDADVQAEFDAYNEDLCVIPVTFSKKTERDAFLAEIKELTGEALLAKFTEKWDGDDASDDDETYLDEDFTCEYQREVYVDIKDTDYRDLIFDEDFEVGAYRSYTDSSSVYHVIYKADEAQSKDDYSAEKEADLKAHFKQELIDAKITTTFINEELKKLRKENKFTIYDPTLAEQYKTVYDVDVYKEMKDKKDTRLVTTTNINMSTDNLYDVLKERYAVSTALDAVNYAAVTTSEFKAIQLTKSEKESIKTQIQNEKRNFFNQGYGIEWLDYLGYLYNVQSEAELEQQRAFQTYLAQRYILGFKEYEGARPVTNEEVINKNSKWLDADNNYQNAYQTITASHILFKFDQDGDGDITDDERARAEKLALQIINGVDPENRLEDDDNIEFLYDKDDKTEKEEFQGLVDLDTNKYTFKTVFETLAKNYSDDSSKSSGGSLGKFGPSAFDKDGKPIRMVVPFEEAAVDLANNNNQKYSIVPVETEYGFHIIYVTASEKAPELPTGFFDLTEEEIADKIEAGDEAVKAYNTYFNNLKNPVKSERLSEEAVNYELALLRDELGFKFLDSAIEAHYAKLQASYLDFSYDEEEAETE
jgi:hypothetical protein